MFPTADGRQGALFVGGEADVSVVADRRGDVGYPDLERGQSVQPYRMPPRSVAAGPVKERRISLIPSTQLTSSSTARRYCCGFRACTTPAGVPVRRCRRALAFRPARLERLTSETNRFPVRHDVAAAPGEAPTSTRHARPDRPPHPSPDTHQR